MITSKKIETIMGTILFIGGFLSTLLVLFGGTLYLINEGHQPLQNEMLRSYSFNFLEIWKNNFFLTSLGIIQLGLILLVFTQFLRIVLLAWFYTIIRDYWFTAISIFILLILLYSFIWRN